MAGETSAMRLARAMTGEPATGPAGPLHLAVGLGWLSSTLTLNLPS
jgi:hypothetical protein